MATWAHRVSFGSPRADQNWLRSHRTWHIFWDRTPTKNTWGHLGCTCMFFRWFIAALQKKRKTNLGTELNSFNSDLYRELSDCQSEHFPHLQVKFCYTILLINNIPYFKRNLQFLFHHKKLFWSFSPMALNGLRGYHQTAPDIRKSFLILRNTSDQAEIY